MVTKTVPCQHFLKGIEHNVPAFHKLKISYEDVSLLLNFRACVYFLIKYTADSLLHTIHYMSFVEIGEISSKKISAIVILLIDRTSSILVY